MAIQIFHKQEIGNGLEYVDSKVSVKAADDTITVTEAGIKANIPAVPEVPVSVKEITVNGNALTVTKTDNTSETLDLPQPQQVVDIHLNGLTFADGKLTATLSDGTTKDVDFTAEVIVQALEGADEPTKKRLAKTLLDVIKGTEVQDLAGNTEGFLLPVSIETTQVI